jgi:hypothetical protein
LKFDGDTLLSAIGSTPDWTSNITTKFVLSKIDIDNNKYTVGQYYEGQKMLDYTITATLTDGNLSITVNTIEASIQDGTYTKQ